MERFFENLSNQIEMAVKEDSKKILKEIRKEKIYSVALVTDSDCITLFLAVNTYKHMKKKDKKYAKMFKNTYPKEKIKKVKDGSISFTKWSVAEWGYSDGSGSELNKIGKLLYEKEEENPQEYKTYNKLFLDTVTTTLKKLKEEKAFGENSEEIMFFISMSDDEKAIEIENTSAKLLNSEKQYKEFLERLEWWAE